MNSDEIIKGTYKPDDVTLLLKDVTDLVTPVTTEEKERLIQSGTHYSELLQKEWEPSDDYLEFYRKTLDHFSPVISQLVATVSTEIIKDKWENTVLVSLARAGTPIGILIKRYIKYRWDIDVPHYTISIIRDKGIDKNAMNYIVEKHGEKWIQFIDGWTGKGTIKGQLENSLAQYHKETGHHIKPDLAVLSDPARVADKWGTREDVLIPNACLNANVSGMLSRTFLKDGIIGEKDFHGCAKVKGDNDFTYTFIDKVVDNFSKVKTVRMKGDSVLCEYAGVKYLFNEKEKEITPQEEIKEIVKVHGLPSAKHCKPSIGEATRVLLRREPWKILISDKAENLEDVKLLCALAKEKGIPIESYPLKNYKAVGLIKVLH